MISQHVDLLFALFDGPDRIITAMEDFFAMNFGRDEPVKLPVHDQHRYLYILEDIPDIIGLA